MRNRSRAYIFLIEGINACNHRIVLGWRRFAKIDLGGGRVRSNITAGHWCIWRWTLRTGEGCEKSLR